MIGAQVVVGFLGAQEHLVAVAADTELPLPLGHSFVMVLDPSKGTIYVPKPCITEARTRDGFVYTTLRVSGAVGTMQCCFGAMVRAMVRPACPD
jgi:hypothetical protein